MNTTRPCGCKGVRTCLQCESEFLITKVSWHQQFQKLDSWSFCPLCERIFPGWDTNAVLEAHDAEVRHNGHDGLHFPGVLVLPNFLTCDEASAVMNTIDNKLPWTSSQSGRRKQNFGPKTNFRKRKLKNGNFRGFPRETSFIQHRLCEIPLLSDFQAIEQCSLEYEPLNGASIDPHVDDCWIWGERVVTVNCLGDSVLTLTALPTELEATKYNLDMVSSYESKLILPLADEVELQKLNSRVIRIPMPNLSLIVLYGPARYQYEHSVLREDIRERRVCIAYREFTPMYLEGGDDWLNGGETVIKNAQTFWDDK